MHLLVIFGPEFVTRMSFSKRAYERRCRVLNYLGSQFVLPGTCFQSNCGNHIRVKYSLICL